MREFDSIIIGTGQAGFPLSRALAENGEQVAILESEQVGGTCVNTGCTPTKALVAAARRAHVGGHSGEFGFHAGESYVDFNQAMQRTRNIVEEFRASVLDKKLSHENITLVREKGEFVDEKTVAAGEERLRGDKIFINTGASPFVPPIEGIEEVSYYTYKTMLELEERPEHLVILGGGYVGLEYAQMMRRFGSEVTIIEAGSQLASTEDEDVSELLKRVLEDEGINVHLNSRATSVQQREEGIVISCKYEDGEEYEVDGSHLLVATGRRPNSDINTEAAGLEKDENGYIQVNNRLETTTKNIWAMGDVAGSPAFTHVAFNDFEIVAHNLRTRRKRTTDDRVLVYAMFTDPSFGRVGLTEQQAEAEGYRVLKAEAPMEHVARGIELGETKGKIKVVADEKSKKLLGAAVLSHEGAEVIHSLAAYINMEATYEEAQQALGIHPTIGEGVQTVLQQFGQ